MCGRFAQAQSLVTSAMEAGIDLQPTDFNGPEAAPRYNVAPGTRAWLFRWNSDTDMPSVALMLWRFLTPRGMRINARSETAAVVPEYRQHFAQTRAVVPVSGFYEPEGEKGAKNRPWWYFQPTLGSTLFLGAIIGPDGFSILTCAASPPLSAIHDRSPVLVPPDRVRDWMSPRMGGKQAMAITHAPPLHCWRVGDGAKKPGNEGVDLIAPLQGHSLD